MGAWLIHVLKNRFKQVETSNKLAVKRTTIPLLYNLKDSIEGLDVIDFPGIDDSDHTVPELSWLLLSLAQIIIFVVDFQLVELYSETQLLFSLYADENSQILTFVLC